MTLLLAGLIIFFAAHLYSAFRSRSPGQDIKERLGEKPYMGLYSLVSLVGFVLIIIGYGAMRPSSVLYTAPEWGRMLNLTLMPFVLIIFVSSQMPAGYVKKFFKHPMLVSVKLWAILHLLSNGELNSVLLFGAFLVYATIDRIAVKRRADMGAAVAVPTVKWDIIALIVGIGVYIAFVLGLHTILIGVPPV